MELDGALIAVEEQILDEAHFPPVRRPPVGRHRHMLPPAELLIVRPLPIGGDDEQVGAAWAIDFESTEPVAGLTGILAGADAVLFELGVEFHLAAFSWPLGHSLGKYQPPFLTGGFFPLVSRQWAHQASH